MLLMRFLGFLDLVTALMILGFEFGVVPFWVFFPFSFDLFAKAIVFRSGWVSLFDAVIGAYMLLMVFWSSPVVSVLLALYLTQKGLFSLF